MSASTPDEEDREIGRKLAYQRKKLKISQAKMAEFLSVSPQQYGKYERGENQISHKTYRRIKDIFRSLSQNSGFGEEGQSEYLMERGSSSTYPAFEKILEVFDELQVNLDSCRRIMRRETSRVRRQR